MILVWFLLFPAPTPDPTTVQTPTAQSTTQVNPDGTVPATQAPTLAATPAMTRAAALAQTQRVAIKTKRLSGSLSLLGGRIDDLNLTDYFETIAKDSPTVTLLNSGRCPGSLLRALRLVAGRRDRRCRGRPRSGASRAAMC